MRLFVAVGVPEISLEGVRIGGPEAPPHLTVLFLGEVDAARAAALPERFASAVRGRPPFPLELTGVGVFPNEAHPRVVWVGVGAGARELRELHDALVGACRELALSVDDRPLVPHLTVRRVRGPRDAELARRWVAEFGARAFGRTEVSELLLRESLLGARPVVHRTIARLPLEGAAVPG
ncbi:MAG TPA: RNA 2',3'-cyclic phosphodiesterase [Thermoplasmata archaeon]|nr:RNA 2',3'-cyclic phosphodiesterase [Thermoplasmata archaeon]